jgi:hypothetical protein
MSEIGFVIASYSEPEQLLTLAKRLSSMFTDARISFAHDFGQTPLDTARFPPGVSFVQPHESTRWGHISVIRAGLRALRNLYEQSNPDWFVLLSGSDYPVASAESILHDLRTSPYDAFLDHREISASAALSREIGTFGQPGGDGYGFDHPRWATLAYDRYVTKTIDIPWLNRRLHRTRKKIVVRDPRLMRALHPFRNTPRCFGGDHWFIANRRAARILLDELESSGPFITYFSERHIPEEAFYQTVLCNCRDLRTDPNNRRYSDWSAGGPHPKWLGVDDLPAIASSRAHFARKFPPGSAALKLLDRAIDERRPLSSVLA